MATLSALRSAVASLTTAVSDLMTRGEVPDDLVTAVNDATTAINAIAPAPAPTEPTGPSTETPVP